MAIHHYLMREHNAATRGNTGTQLTHALAWCWVPPQWEAKLVYKPTPTIVDWQRYLACTSYYPYHTSWLTITIVSGIEGWAYTYRLWGC
jgi:hypothetical protein